MTYNEAKAEAEKYAGIIGKAMLNKMNFLDERKITSLLITPPKKLKMVFSDWWCNGNDNKKAIAKIDSDENFEVFVMSYYPSVEAVIYFLRLHKYIQLGN
ncbi:hypothetical protein FRZ67_13690 [Panacibacter ginsenosidivorans]|uniref:Uncharacterized protein n=1 Tax=Panacibacter ginsenosidivorans TaxID=1813871 RepID=A0A5B8VBK1_9BACT|nr:hypothetical protein [Panacibacter ginsenosidivorans]QEC68301.1 hypothetical protein FRZ67_13690 [Panacibacter ginsenosidivorans]